MTTEHTTAENAAVTQAGTGEAATGGGAELLLRLTFGALAAQTVRAALRLRIVEIVGAGRRRAAEVAEDAGTAEQPTNRLLRAMTGLGLLQEHSPGVFSVTPAGALLDPKHPGSLSSLVRVFTEPVVLKAWEHLDDSVRSGEIAFDTAFGTDFFSHLRQLPELSAEFNSAMSQATQQTAAVLPRAFDFGRFATVTDVGGGDGTLLSAVLREHPSLAGVVFDTEAGLGEAPATLRHHRLASRCSLATGDFFRSVPAGADLFLIKSVLHDWTDEQVVTILSHCRKVLPARGRVLIVEPVLPEVVDPASAGLTYLSDLNMLVNVGGRERTRAEFEAVCRAAGLALVSVTPLPGAEPYSLLEAAAA